MPAQNVLYDQTFANQTANFFAPDNVTWINTHGDDLVTIFFLVTINSGTGVTVQADLMNVFADGSSVDFYNNGTHTATFVYTIGPNCPQNFVCPERLRLSMAIAGTTPNVTIRIVVLGSN